MPSVVQAAVLPVHGEGTQPHAAVAPVTTHCWCAPLHVSPGAVESTHTGHPDGTSSWQFCTTLPWHCWLPRVQPPAGQVHAPFEQVSSVDGQVRAACGVPQPVPSSTQGLYPVVPAHVAVPITHAVAGQEHAPAVHGWLAEHVTIAAT
jgi:hypothetical protein